MKNAFERGVDISKLNGNNLVDFTVPEIVAWVLKYYKNDPLGALTHMHANLEIGNVTYVRAKMILEGGNYAKIK